MQEEIEETTVFGKWRCEVKCMRRRYLFTEEVVLICYFQGRSIECELFSGTKCCLQVLNVIFRKEQLYEGRNRVVQSRRGVCREEVVCEKRE